MVLLSGMPPEKCLRGDASRAHKDGICAPHTHRHACRGLSTFFDTFATEKTGSQEWSVFSFPNLRPPIVFCFLWGVAGSLSTSSTKHKGAGCCFLFHDHRGSLWVISWTNENELEGNKLKQTMAAIG